MTGRLDDPKVDPFCPHHQNYTHRVSSHADLAAADEAGDAIASTYVCWRPDCQTKAIHWVQHTTGHLAVIRSLRR